MVELSSLHSTASEDFKCPPADYYSRGDETEVPPRFYYKVEILKTFISMLDRYQIILNITIF